MPLGLEKHEFRNRIEPTLKTILAFLFRQDSNAGMEMISFLPNITPKEPKIRLRPFQKPSSL